MNKKAVELSMNVIIIAAIALLVLVILSAIFIGRMGFFGKSVGECSTQGGKCAVECGSEDYRTLNYPTVNPTIACEDTKAGERQVCCMPIRT